MKSYRVTLALAAIVAGTSCATFQATVQTVLHPHTVTPEQARIISDSVHAIVADYTVATARLDSTRVFALITGDTAFEAVLNGEVVSGEAAFTKLVRNSFPTLPPTDVHVDSVHVTVMSPVSALANVSFRQTESPSSGEDRGVITYGLVHRKEGWRIVYQHVTSSR